MRTPLRQPSAKFLPKEKPAAVSDAHCLRGQPLPAAKPAQSVQWLSTPGGLTALLILVSMLMRLAFAAVLGLGIDESYMTAAGRDFQISYFDHPPLSWWLSRGVVLLSGHETAFIVRLPFILIFAVSTWLMYRLGARLFSEEAGLWAAIAMNLSPVLGITTASWVLPDGPLLCALLGFALALSYALEDGGWRYWVAVGVCGGVALLSKYIAMLPLAGAGIYVLTQRDHRAWLARPQPYAAALIAFAIFSPVIIWNASHDWASFAFQGGRANGSRLNLLGPLTVLGGEALFILPWIWAALMAVFIAAIRRGPQDRGAWLLVCLGALPVVLFAVIALWSRQRILFHWAAPGYAMLFPLLGHAIATRIAAGNRVIPHVARATAGLIVAVLLIVGSDFQFNWLPKGGTSPLKEDVSAQALDWTPLRAELKARGLLDGPSGGDAKALPPVFGAFRWHDTGKLGFALGPSAEVICLSGDARQYGIVRPMTQYAGRDVIIAVPGSRDGLVAPHLFERVEPLEPFILLHAGRPALRISLYRGVHLRP